MIETINLSKVYNDGVKELRVLKSVNLKISPGEFVAIVGPSGAGKSTLLHSLGGLDEPTEGKVIFDNVDLYEMSDKARARIRNRRIGFVFQFYHLLPEFNMIENVMMPALISRQSPPCGGRPATSHELKDLKKIKYNAAQLLDAVGLAGRLTHRPNQLSGGEQQRVAIARALINSPNVLLCDEPTGNLDSKTGNDVMEVLLKLNKKESVTCVMVTHQESLVSSSNRILHMMDGGIL